MVPPASLALTRLTPGFAGPSPHGEGIWPVCHQVWHLAGCSCLVLDAELRAVGFAQGLAEQGAIVRRAERVAGAEMVAGAAFGEAAAAALGQPGAQYRFEAGGQAVAFSPGQAIDNIGPARRRCAQPDPCAPAR